MIRVKKRWLQELEPGDLVVMQVNSTDYQMYSVEKVTKNFVTVTGGERFRRSDGQPVGSIGNCTRKLLEYNDQLAEKIQESNDKRRLVNILLDTDWDEFPVSVLEDIVKRVR